MTTDKDEALLSAWLCLCGRVKNDRIVKGMSFNEIFVCNILHGLSKGESVSATDIVEKTGMLKSQVNKVLSDLEGKNMISRNPSKEDKRKIEVMLTEEGASIYEKEHESVLLLMQKLRKKLGEKQVENATKTLYLLAEAMREIE